MQPTRGLPRSWRAPKSITQIQSIIFFRLYRARRNVRNLTNITHRARQSADAYGELRVIVEILDQPAVFLHYLNAAST